MRDHVSTNIRFPAALHRALKHRAVSEGRSLADLVREAAETYLVSETGPEARSELEDWGDDPLASLWRQAEAADVTDGAEKHDLYLYGPEQVAIEK